MCFLRAHVLLCLPMDMEQGPAPPGTSEPTLGWLPSSTGVGSYCAVCARWAQVGVLELDSEGVTTMKLRCLRTARQQRQAKRSRKPQHVTPHLPTPGACTGLQ